MGGRGYLCHPCIANLWVLIDDDRNVLYQELEDLRSEHGDNHHGQPDDEEEYQRRFSSVSGPDNQVKNTTFIEMNLNDAVVRISAECRYVEHRHIRG